MKEISFKDVRITIGDRRFLLTQVPFRGNEGKVLPASKLAEIVAKRLAGSDSISSFRHGDDARKAWEYLSQRTNRDLEIVEVSAAETLAPVKKLQPENIGVIILSTEFQGKTREFLVGLKGSREVEKLLEESGPMNYHSFPVYQDVQVINGLSNSRLTELVDRLNEQADFRLELPSHAFIKHVVGPIIEKSFEKMGAWMLWLSDSKTLPETELRKTLYTFGGGAYLTHDFVNFNIGVILEISRAKSE